MALPKKRSGIESNYLKKIYLFYGEPKAGKTTTAAGFGDDDKNKVLFFCCEPGHKFQSIYKWEVSEKGEAPTMWEHFQMCARDLATQKHEFKCLVIDTVDNLFDWCANYTNKKQEIEHESDLGFGKGYAAIKKEFQSVINFIGQKDIGIIFISHAKHSEIEVNKRKMTHVGPSLGNTASKVVLGLCDYIFYFSLDHDGSRIIATKGSESIVAGDRSGKLPGVIPMDVKKLIEVLNG